MAYRLQNDLSCCEVDGHLVFLDIGKDRYFRLSDEMEQRFIMHRRGTCPDYELAKLVDSGLLAECPPEEAPNPPTMERPIVSAMEQASHEKRSTATDLLQVLGTVTLAQLQLKTLSLKQVLFKLDAFRQRMAVQSSESPPPALEGRLVDAATAFLHARPYVPIETCCLVDSISMIRFLAKRGLAANLVFGVTGAPFSAHCWVQAGHMVLNDTVGNTHAHTPVRVV